MTKEDRQLAKDSALAAIGAILSANPALAAAWALTGTLLGNGIKLRQQKALGWVEMMRDNSEVFTQGVLSDQAFQDGMVFAVEKYLAERSETKREHARQIFLGFAKSTNKATFAIERYLHTLSQLSETDLQVLATIDVGRIDRNYQPFPTHSPELENLLNLVNLGLLVDTTGNRIGGAEDDMFVKISSFGNEFVGYITTE